MLGTIDIKKKYTNTEKNYIIHKKNTKSCCNLEIALVLNRNKIL